MNKEAKSLIYLNTAGVGLLSEAAVAASESFNNASLTNASGAFMKWMEERLPNLRNLMASLIHTRLSQIVFLPNFSFGLISVVNSIRPSIKKVLLYRDDYPSLNLPFELGGFEVYYAESHDGFSISLERIKEITEKEKIEAIAISHVQFLTGFTIDLEALGNYCSKKNITLIVDATQSLGAVNLNFDTLPVDVLISSSYKWLNGGIGSAVMCMKESFMKRFPPRMAGFGSMTHTMEGWSYQPSATSYEPGHLNAVGLLHLEKSIEQRLFDKVASVVAYNGSMVKQLTDGLRELSYKIRGGYETKHLSTILCIEAEKDVADYLQENRIVVTWRKGLIRVSPHFYNNAEEIGTLLKVLMDYKNKMS